MQCKSRRNYGSRGSKGCDLLRFLTSVITYLMTLEQWSSSKGRSNLELCYSRVWMPCNPFGRWPPRRGHLDTSHGNALVGSAVPGQTGVAVTQGVMMEASLWLGRPPGIEPCSGGLKAHPRQVQRRA
jgi:hypothetical protein